ncbi:MAG: VCBS repeat-containing protein [Planctomycetes bacterium]|nr:VCBS repeat-containing protein [Planctomycetota bacterium]
MNNPKMKTQLFRLTVTLSMLLFTFYAYAYNPWITKPDHKAARDVFIPVSTSKPVKIADIDPNYPGLEICFSGNSYNHSFHVYHEDGTVVPGFPQPLGEPGKESGATPAVGDIDNDGDLEIVVGAQVSNKLYIFNHDGSLLNEHWPMAVGEIVAYTTPVLANLNEDPFLEILIGIQNKLLIFNQFGERLVEIPIEPGGWSFTNPTVADIDQDGLMDIILAWDGNWDGSIDSKVAVFNADGTLKNGWPVIVDGLIMKNLAVGDISKETAGPEICAIEEMGNVVNVYIFSSDAKQLNGWPVSFNQYIGSAPSLANIVQEDEDLEIMLTVVDSAGDSRLHILNVHGQEINSHWPVDLHDFASSPPISGYFDEDNQLDVAIGTEGGEGVAGIFYILDREGNNIIEPVKTSSRRGWGFTYPATADIDGDKKPEIIIGSFFDGIYRFDLESTNAHSDWSQYQHDAQNTGNYENRPKLIKNVELLEK